MSGYPHHFGPRPQTDLEAANSATPDTDRPPLWDDPEHERYIQAVDPEFYYTYIEPDEELAEECAEDRLQRKFESGDWDDEDEAEAAELYGYDDDGEDKPDDPGWAEDERDMARIAREWDAFDRDPPGS